MEAARAGSHLNSENEEIRCEAQARRANRSQLLLGDLCGFGVWHTVVLCSLSRRKLHVSACPRPPSRRGHHVSGNSPGSTSTHMRARYAVPVSCEPQSFYWIFTSITVHKQFKATVSRCRFHSHAVQFGIIGDSAAPRSNKNRVRLKKKLRLEHNRIRLELDWNWKFITQTTNNQELNLIFQNMIRITLTIRMRVRIRIKNRCTMRIRRWTNERKIKIVK